METEDRDGESKRHGGRDICLRPSFLLMFLYTYPPPSLLLQAAFSGFHPQLVMKLSCLQFLQALTRHLLE